MKSSDSARSRVARRSPSIFIGLIVGMVAWDLIRQWLGLTPHLSPVVFVASWVVGGVIGWLVMGLSFDAFRRDPSGRDSQAHR